VPARANNETEAVRNVAGSAGGNRAASRMSDADTADPATALGGGSIVVRKTGGSKV
jgi:hypothetical protein